MPDPILIVTAVALAGVASAVVLWICGWPWRSPRPTIVGAGWVLGVAVGFVSGCLILKIWPHWPFRQDQDRLLGVVFPAIVMVELLAAFPGVSRWLIWPSRLVVAGVCAPVLLHGSSYLNDLAGPGTREWPPGQAALILVGMGVALATIWGLLALLARRASELSRSVSLAIVIAGAAVTIMLSGYASGGLIGLPLAGALAGAATAALAVPASSRGSVPIGAAVVGLFSLLTIGHFFGHLSATDAALLFCAPLLGWIPELPHAQRLPRWGRGVAALVLVGALVSAIVLHAQKKFVEDFSSPSGSAPKQPSVEDYLNFGR